MIPRAERRDINCPVMLNVQYHYPDRNPVENFYQMLSEKKLIIFKSGSASRVCGERGAVICCSLGRRESAADGVREGSVIRLYYRKIRQS
jgi:hypothetical protein